MKIVEQEMHEAWRAGREEGGRAVAGSAIPEILEARFGPAVRATGAAIVKFLDEDELAEIVVLVAICPDFASFYGRALSEKRKARR